MNSGIGFQGLGWVRCNIKIEDNSRKPMTTRKGVYSASRLEEIAEATKDKARGQEQVKKQCLNNIDLKV